MYRFSRPVGVKSHYFGMLNQERVGGPRFVFGQRNQVPKVTFSLANEKVSSHAYRNSCTNQLLRICSAGPPKIPKPRDNVSFFGGNENYNEAEESLGSRWNGAGNSSESCRRVAETSPGGCQEIAGASPGDSLNIHQRVA